MSPALTVPPPVTAGVPSSIQATMNCFTYTDSAGCPGRTRCMNLELDEGNARLLRGELRVHAAVVVVACAEVSCGTGTEPLAGSPLQSSSAQLTLANGLIPFCTTSSADGAAGGGQKPKRTCSPRHARYGTFASSALTPFVGTVADAGLTATPVARTIAVTAPSSIFLKRLKSCSSPIWNSVVPSASLSDAVPCTTRALPWRSPLRRLTPCSSRRSRRRDLQGDVRWLRTPSRCCADAG